jgi:hypothetical protein
MNNIYGQFDMRSMSGVTHKSLRSKSAIACSATQDRHRDPTVPESSPTRTDKLQRYKDMYDAGELSSTAYQILVDTAS